MSDEAPPPLWKVVFVVAFYMAVALTMVVVNKWVLISTDLPLTFLFFQLVIAVLCLQAWSANKSASWTAPRWSKAQIQAMIPASAVNIVGLIFNLYCLKLVDASYFQVARGLVLPMTIALQAGTSHERPSPPTLAACALVTYGFMYSLLPWPFGAGQGIAAEAPVFGMVLGVLSAAMIAAHAILIKSALRHVDGSALDLAYWTNILSAVAVAPLVLLSGEVPSLLRLVSGEGAPGELRAFAIGSIVTGLVGFLICVGGLLSIKITSPVTHMFSSAARSVLQTILGVHLFGDILNTSRVTSISLIVVGTLLYTYYKSKPFVAAAAALRSDREEETRPLAGAHGGVASGSGEVEKGVDLEEREKETV